MSSCNIKREIKETKDSKSIENSIIKKYRKQLWTKFIKGSKEFNMINPGDKIAICISGGKDSLLLAKLFQEYQKHVDSSIELHFICMDPGFTKYNRNLLEKTCQDLDIPLDIFETQVFEIVEEIAADYPCYMCARMRRGNLYAYAEKLGCNKIALGHHYDDFIETIMLNILYAGSYQAMMPVIQAKNFEKLELIRPLIYVREKDILQYNDYNKINNMDCGCIVAAKQTSSKRREVKELIAKLAKDNPLIEKNIFASSLNVNLDAIIGWKKNKKKYTFQD